MTERCNHKISLKQNGFKSSQEADQSATSLITQVGHQAIANISRVENDIVCDVTFTCNASNHKGCLVEDLKKHGIKVSHKVKRGCNFKHK